MELQMKIDLMHKMILEMQRKNTEMMNQIKKESEQINMISQKFEQIVNVVNAKKEKEKEKAYTSLKDKNKNHLIKMTMILLEGYANKFGKVEQRTNIYSEHNYKDTAHELKSQIISQLEILRMTHTLYSKEYGKYDFQSNLSQSHMIHSINMWKMMVPPEDQKYYEAAIDIIQGKPSQSFTNELDKGESLKKKYRKTPIEQKKPTQTSMNFYEYRIPNRPNLNGMPIREEPLITDNNYLDYPEKKFRSPAPLKPPTSRANIRPSSCIPVKPSVDKTLTQEQQRSKENEQLDSLLKKITNIIEKMDKEGNVETYLNNYNSDFKKFSQLYKQFIGKYKFYLYKNDKDNHKTKIL